MQTPDGLALIAYLRENLEIKVETHREYTGGDPLYEDLKTIKLVLEGETISETLSFS